MPVLINFKICDNAKECNGVSVCPTGALSWDAKKESIVINNDVCIECTLCEKSCMVHAIKVAKTSEEYQRYKKEFDDDPRKISDLYLDRYGAQPILDAFLITRDKFDLEVMQSSKLTAVELFTDDSIMCMLRSIPIKEIFQDLQVKFRKLESDEQLKKNYNIKHFPALLFFEEGKLLGKVEGYYSKSEKGVLLEKIRKCIEEINEGKKKKVGR